jgi:hypothetical protein
MPDTIIANITGASLTGTDCIVLVSVPRNAPLYILRAVEKAP